MLVVFVVVYLATGTLHLILGSLMFFHYLHLFLPLDVDDFHSSELLLSCYRPLFPVGQLMILELLLKGGLLERYP